VLTQRGIDVEAGIEECELLSLLLVDEPHMGQRFLSMPLIAREFAERKLQGDPDRLLILADLETVRKFGPMSGPAVSPAAQQDQVNRFVAWATSLAQAGTQEDLNKADKALSTLADYWPSAWRHLGVFRRTVGASSDETAYAFRKSCRGGAIQQGSVAGSGASCGEHERSRDTYLESGRCRRGRSC